VPAADLYRDPVLRTPFIHAPMAQTFLSLYWYDQLLRELGIRGVIELGTGSGILTVLFGLHCPGAVTTIDLIDRRDERTRDLHQRLGITQSGLDCRRDIRLAGDLIAALPTPRLVFCDNGNKPEEFALYAPMLGSGDAIAVHDSGTEFFSDQEDTQRVAAAANLVRWRQQELDDDETLIAAWVRP